VGGSMLIEFSIILWVISFGNSLSKVFRKYFYSFKMPFCNLQNGYSALSPCKAVTTLGYRITVTWHFSILLPNTAGFSQSFTWICRLENVKINLQKSNFIFFIIKSLYSELTKQAFF